MVKLKKITDSSWLVLTGDGLDRVGLLSEQRDKLVLIAKQARTEFKDRNDVETFFNDGVFDKVEETSEIKDQVEHFVKGYPTNATEVFEVDSECPASNLPLFTKKEHSKSVMVAGYFCLHFEKAGWVHAYCPKLDTLTKYEYQGPFKTHDEMKSVLRSLRRK